MNRLRTAPTFLHDYMLTTRKIRSRSRLEDLGNNRFLPTKWSERKETVCEVFWTPSANSLICSNHLEKITKDSLFSSLFYFPFFSSGWTCDFV